MHHHARVGRCFVRFAIPNHGEQRTHNGTFEVHEVASAIIDDFFWAFVKIINVLAAVGNHIYSWSHSCSCHSGDALDFVVKTIGACPKAGRILLELAA